MTEICLHVGGEEVSLSSPVGRETTSVEVSFARSPSPAVEIMGVDIDDGGEIVCDDSPGLGLGDFLLSFPNRFLRCH